MFDKISTKDSSLILQELDKENIDYKIVENGIIVVPKEDVYKTRIKVASLGIGQDHSTGFELFNKSENSNNQLFYLEKMNQFLLKQLLKKLLKI